MERLPKIIVVKTQGESELNRWVAYTDTKIKPIWAFGDSPEEALGKLVMHHLYLVKNYVEIRK